MSSEPERATEVTEAGLSEFALDYGQLHTNGGNSGPPAGHREAQRRARVPNSSHSLTVSPRAWARRRPAPLKWSP